MPLAKINIEEVRPGVWRSEVEAGRPTRRRLLQATSWDDSLQMVIDAYAELVPQPLPVPDNMVRALAVPEGGRVVPVSPAPIGKRAAARMRAAADAAAVAADPALRERMGMLQTRKL